MEPTIIIIFGISGDLAKRKLLPAITKISKLNMLPSRFCVVGVTRRKLKKSDLLPSNDQAFLSKHLDLFQIDITNPDYYTLLAKHLTKIEQSWGVNAQRLFYLSIPPQLALPIVRFLGKRKLLGKKDKLLLEKPFGTDLESAVEYVETLRKFFSEEQIYRIDHFLAKEMAQNIIVFRSGNSLFRQTWNKDFVKEIEIEATEKIGIEGRNVFYEQTGALKDVLQSHLLQLAALVLMGFDDLHASVNIPGLRLEALKHIELDGHPSNSSKRAQYAGYRNEVRNPHSNIETFASLNLISRDNNWDGVPIRITTGKGLSEKSTRITIRFRKQHASETNELVISIQPKEGIELSVWSKTPGFDRKLQKQTLKFSYSKSHRSNLPEAYERVLMDSMRSDHTLFTTSEEVLAAWKIIAPVQEAWNLANIDIPTYDFGSSANEVLAKI